MKRLKAIKHKIDKQKQGNTPYSKVSSFTLNKNSTVIKYDDGRTELRQTPNKATKKIALMIVLTALVLST